ncbi:hypothetical protein APY94_03785 [Thermococcus celericrescens]|uniref:Uncharacterized protein n=1 Tax=Thermococcus celericrescens TaxID=227598 RepID=A0A100XYT0_9EURY|nr:hypothetical protein [Thermococcus celericrescens]KUH34004.1 hypothetical protein APY94_03785 [Thermococcus celericrescens]
MDIFEALSAWFTAEIISHSAPQSFPVEKNPQLHFQYSVFRYLEPQAVFIDKILPRVPEEDRDLVRTFMREPTLVHVFNYLKSKAKMIESVTIEEILIDENKLEESTVLSDNKNLAALVLSADEELKSTIIKQLDEVLGSISNPTNFSEEDIKKRILSALASSLNTVFSSQKRGGYLDALVVTPFENYLLHSSKNPYFNERILAILSQSFIPVTYPQTRKLTVVNDQVQSILQEKPQKLDDKELQSFLQILSKCSGLKITPRVSIDVCNSLIKVEPHILYGDSLDSSDKTSDSIKTPKLVVGVHQELCESIDNEFVLIFEIHPHPLQGITQHILGVGGVLNLYPQNGDYVEMLRPLRINISSTDMLLLLGSRYFSRLISLV